MAKSIFLWALLAHSVIIISACRTTTSSLEAPYMSDANNKPSNIASNNIDSTKKVLSAHSHSNAHFQQYQSDYVFANLQSTRGRLLAAGGYVAGAISGS